MTSTLKDLIAQHDEGSPAIGGPGRGWYAGITADMFGQIGEHRSPAMSRDTQAYANYMRPK